MSAAPTPDRLEVLGMGNGVFRLVTYADDGRTVVNIHEGDLRFVTGCLLTTLAPGTDLVLRRDKRRGRTEG